jgi:hypothetical protein
VRPALHHLAVLDHPHLVVVADSAQAVAWRLGLRRSARMVPAHGWHLQSLMWRSAQGFTRAAGEFDGVGRTSVLPEEYGSLSRQEKHQDQARNAHQSEGGNDHRYDHYAY